MTLSGFQKVSEGRPRGVPGPSCGSPDGAWGLPGCSFWRGAPKTFFHMEAQGGSMVPRGVPRRDFGQKVRKKATPAEQKNTENRTELCKKLDCRQTKGRQQHTTYNNRQTTDDTRHTTHETHHTMKQNIQHKTHNKHRHMARNIHTTHSTRTHTSQTVRDVRGSFHRGVGRGVNPLPLGKGFVGL